MLSLLDNPLYLLSSVDSVCNSSPLGPLRAPTDAVTAGRFCYVDQDPEDKKFTRYGVVVRRSMW